MTLQYPDVLGGIPMRRRRAVANDSGTFYALVSAAVVAIVAAVAGAYKVWKDSAAAAKTAELLELRDFRKELRDEILQLRTRQNDLETKLAQAQAEIQEQRGHFVGILFKLEGILALQDATLITSHLQNIIVYLRQVLEMPIGEPERRRHVLEERK
jgi:uncharacterized protein YlxW (UPF0749 family)